MHPQKKLAKRGFQKESIVTLFVCLYNLLYIFSNEKDFSNSEITKPKLYLWYIDDVLVVFDNVCTRECFLQVLNSQHPLKNLLHKQQQSR